MISKQIENDMSRHNPKMMRLPRDSINNAKTR
jgi:hypothetical protein